MAIHLVNCRKGGISNSEDLSIEEQEEYGRQIQKLCLCELGITCNIRINNKRLN